MKLSRPRLAAAALPIALAAAGGLTLGAAGPAAAPRAHGGAVALRPAGPPPARGVVIVTCAGRKKVRPATFVLACADGNSLLTGMRWRTWQSSAYGTGAWRVNDCVPSCAAGTFYDYPALTVLWRPEQLGRSASLLHYTRLTMILPGRHCFTAKGKRSCYPVTATTDLREPPSG